MKEKEDEGLINDESHAKKERDKLKKKIADLQRKIDDKDKEIENLNQELGRKRGKKMP
ncbi:MAG: hypothetical protein AB1540_00030 [Bdellovibrionota bacterium]